MNASEALESAESPSASRSVFLRVRGLRYHLRCWGNAEAPPLFILHGFMDVSATFDPVARLLAQRRQVIAPDWRGFGHTQWAQDGYWFPDYLADLDAIVEHCAPQMPIDLVGHSMGGQVAALYAGLRPSRVCRLALLDSLFLSDQGAEQTVRSYRSWLDDLGKHQRTPSYASFEQLAGRIQAKHSQLSAERAMFIACCWGREDSAGRIALLSDPKHLRRGPKPYRQDESDAIWAQISAETLFIDGRRSPFANALPAGELARRRDLFRNRRETRIDQAGHMLHFDAPEELAGVLGEFFA